MSISVEQMAQAKKIFDAATANPDTLVFYKHKMADEEGIKRAKNCVFNFERYIYRLHVPMVRWVNEFDNKDKHGAYHSAQEARDALTSGTQATRRGVRMIEDPSQYT